MQRALGLSFVCRFPKSTQLHLHLRGLTALPLLALPTIGGSADKQTSTFLRLQE